MPGGIGRPFPLNDAPSESGAVPWESAPATSHVSRFRFWDAREWSFLRNFGYRDGQFGVKGGASVLDVIFRDEKSGGEGPQYSYYFHDHGSGRTLYEKMLASPHPYGEVLYPLVVRAGVEYLRQSR